MWIDKAMRGVVADLKKRRNSIDSCSSKVMVRGRSEVMGEERTNYQRSHEEAVWLIAEPK
jgi:hypothetical protein